MKKYLLWILGLVLLSGHLSPAYSQAQIQNTVNAVIGDISFVKKFGKLPSAHTPEKLRLVTHLNYVEMQLRSQIPEEIPQSLYPQRGKMLDHLHTYIQAGVFPTQSAYQSRRPHFIDEQGRLCAVGYLVSKTAGLDMAQKINAKYRYEYLPKMNMPELNHWVKQSGLTVRELAMIQPTYADTPSFNAPFLEGGFYISFGIVFGWFFLHYIASILSPEFYLSIQRTYEDLITASMALFGGFWFWSSIVALLTPSGTEGAVIILIGPAAFLFFGGLHYLFLQALDQSMKKRLAEQQLTLGNIQLTDGSFATGLQATWHF